MNIRRVLSVAVLSVAVAGLASAQDARSEGKAKPKPLRNTNPPAQKQRLSDSPSWGGPNIQYTRISAMQFTSDVSADSYTSTWIPPSVTEYQRYFDGPGFNHLVSSPTVPGGARIVYVELDFCDASTLDEHVQLDVYDCGFLGGCAPTPLATLVSPSDTVDPCDYTWTNIDHRVYNYTGQTLLDVTFGATDGTNTFAGVVIGYVLDVAPAPLTATFGDVPTDNLFFQFVEALADSGVTGGCQAAPPLFCPNNPVTRAQMATFLAKTVGLGAWE